MIGDYEAEQERRITPLDVCERIEEAILALHPETRKSGWDWSYTLEQSDAQHLADHAQTLDKTRKHFKIEGDTSSWFVSTHESNAVLAICGNSPTAQMRARYISWVNPRNIRLLIEHIRHLESCNRDLNRQLNVSKEAK